MRKPWDRQMLYDMLQDTPAFQAIREEGREEGREALRRALLAIVQARFPPPRMARSARKIASSARRSASRPLLAIVQARFPSPRMARLAKGQAAIIDDPAI